MNGMPPNMPQGLTFVNGLYDHRRTKSKPQYTQDVKYSTKDDPNKNHHQSANSQSPSKSNSKRSSHSNRSSKSRSKNYVKQYAPKRQENIQNINVEVLSYDDKVINNKSTFANEPKRATKSKDFVK